MNSSAATASAVTAGTAAVAKETEKRKQSKESRAKNAEYRRRERRMVKGVIFDMDGTMFDTEHLSTVTWRMAGEKLNLDIDDRLIESFRGGNPAQIRRLFSEALGPDVDYEYVKEVKHDFF